MNYYDEILTKIENAINNKEFDNARMLITNELNQAYIPKDVESKLIEYQESIKNDTIVTKSISDEMIEEFLFDTSEKQLVAVDALNKRNLRDYVELCNKYLVSDGFVNAKALLVDSLIRQEINSEIKLINNGVEYEFIPKYIIPVEQSDGFLSGQHYIQEYYMKEPSKLKMAMDLLFKDMILRLPINQEDEEGIIIAKDIIDYIERAFKA